MTMELVAKRDFVNAAVARLRPVHTVLDIGPGIMPQTLIPAFCHVCAEPHRPYAERLLAEHPDFVVLNSTWAQVVETMLPGSVDAVVLIDVIEHLPKSEGEALLKATVELARSQVVVFTPLGFMPQGDDEATDAWGMDGVDWQIHRSGWSPEDFPGWDIVACEQYHFEDAYGRELETPHGAFYAILDKGKVPTPAELNDLVASLVSENVETRRSYESSTSWKLTRPVRWLGRLLGRG